MRNVATLVGALITALATASPIQYASFYQGGALYHMVVAEVDGDQVSAETRCSQGLVPMRSLFSGDEPVAALTGTFFGPDTQKPIADVVVDGTLVCQGERGSVLAVDWFGKVHIFHPGFHQELDWFPYRFALRGLVRLIEDGRIVPDPRSQHFHDSAIWGRAQRTAVGLTQDGKVVLFATRSAVTLSQLGYAMKGQGVQDAVSLDGGGSTALFYRGQMVVSSARRLCNIFVLYERSPFDNAYSAHLSRVAHLQAEGVLKSIGQKRGH